MKVENFELDNSNVEFKSALDLVQANAQIIYLTGKAGTGKTTFLRYLREVTTKNMAVVAFTGVAAINAGGQTIHSFFKVPFGPFLPNDKRLRTSAEIGDPDKSTIYNYFTYNKDRLQVINNLELLVIDEISMVRCDLLDVIDKILRVFRKKPFLPFGGVQIVLIGDTFQLPPIDKDWHLLEKYYSSPFFFSAKVIESNKPIYIELKKVYRQKEKEFIDILDKVRINQISDSELTFLNSKLNLAFSPGDNKHYITLTTHNATADSINLSRLTQLPESEFVFEATISGEFSDKIMPTDKVLRLKEKAQVIFVKNDLNKGIYNGRIAKIKSITNKSVIAEYEDSGDFVEVEVERQTWNNVRYTWDERDKKIKEEIIGTFTQYPVKLAWAITVHKSQGLTFDRVIADVGASFASGQVYVALSRCTSLSGLVLKSRIDRNAIKIDPRVLEFAKNETPSTLIIKEIESGKADHLYRKAREAVSALNFREAYQNLVKAIKFRNDIETDNFARYFVTKATELSRYKKQLQVLRNKYSVKSGELSDLRESYVRDKKEIENLKEFSLSQQAAIESLNAKLELSEAISKELAKDKILLQKDIELLNRENQLLVHKKVELKKIKDQKNKQLDSLKLDLSKANDEIKQLHSEIIRLSSINWFQKLMGKK